MAIFAELAESSQRIVISKDVLDHMARHRQLRWYSKEAGGQLIGSINASEVVVSTAAGPYRGDQRSRFSYRSNVKAAQEAIEERCVDGLIYLGEWHTHPEDQPSASAADLDAMQRLGNASETKSSSLLMLIQGRAIGSQGLAIYTLGLDDLIRWTISQDDAMQV